MRCCPLLLSASLVALLAGEAVSAETPPIPAAPEAGRPADHRAEISVLMELGMAYAESERWGPAIERFQKVLTLDPGVASAHYGLGRVYYMQQRYQEAEQELLKATELNPRYVDAFATLAFVSQAVKDKRGAIGHIEKAIDLLRAKRVWAEQHGQAGAPLSEEDRALLEGLERRLEKLKRTEKEKAR